MNLFLLFFLSAFASETPKTVDLKIDYSMLICSHDEVFIYPCEFRKLKSEVVHFSMDNCHDFDNGRFCDSEWRPDVFAVDGFGFSAVVIVQSFVETSGANEMTIYGFMKTGKEPEKNETNFSLFIDSGTLHDPVRVAGVTLDLPVNEQGRIVTYTPQLKISPVEK